MVRGGHVGENNYLAKIKGFFDPNFRPEFRPDFAQIFGQIFAPIFAQNFIPISLRFSS